MELSRRAAENLIPLAERAVPRLSEKQLALFTAQSIQSQIEASFKPDLPEGRSALAIDMGGSTMTAVVMQLRDGKLQPYGPLEIKIEEKGGRTFVEGLEWAARFAEQSRMPVGISIAGPVRGTKPVHTENMPVFFSELKERYEGDLANVFSTPLSVANDAIAGLRAGALEVQREGPEIKNVIYIINGSGLNAAVLSSDVVFSAEAGHVPVIPGLNPFEQTDRCRMHGESFVCVESLAAGTAGIENIWLKKTGVPRTAIEVEGLYTVGDELAADLYDNSALVTAHMAVGTAKALGIDPLKGTTAIVAHGGIFKFQDYADRVKQIIDVNLGMEVPLHLTRSTSPNACRDGAALFALENIPKDDEL